MIDNLKVLMKKIPVVGPFLMRFRQRHFRDSSRYWEKRYTAGGNSGSGSFGQLAEFKALFLNSFVAEDSIRSVIEFGCGDGSQLKLAQYPNYIGIDISAQAVGICRSLYAKDASKVFFQSDELTGDAVADLALSLDVIYHLVEDHVFEKYMRNLFAHARRFVIVYPSNLEQDTDSMHVRHRQFTRWVDQNEPDWQLQKTIKNAFPFDPSNADNTSLADFYVFVRRNL